jgi:hypothetical protein
MDFRYIVPTAIIGAIFIGVALDRLKGKPGDRRNILHAAGLGLVVLFCVASVLFYAI